MDNDYPSVPQTGTARRMPAEAVLQPQRSPQRSPMLMVVLEEQVRLIGQVESYTEGLASRLEPILRNEDQEKAINNDGNEKVSQPPFIQALVDNNKRLFRQVRELKNLLDRLEL